MTNPIKPIMSCEQFSDTLADFLEHDVSESRRAEMDAHALTCEDCGPLLADLRKLRVDAANLEPLTPSRDLWAGIAERIETPVVSIGTPAGDRERAVSRRRASVWIGLAAAGLIAATATATYHITRQSLANRTIAAASRPTPVVATLTSPPADSSAKTTAPVPNTKSSAAKPATASTALARNESGRLSAAETYDMEISRLRHVVDRRRGDLDSSTVAVLEKNLRIIDEAIAQCRGALAKDPSSSYLNESLTDALDDKVQLLRAAATLPARS
jgi:hypothetical protein